MTLVETQAPTALVSRTLLHEKLIAVNKAISSKAVMPVLHNIAIQTYQKEDGVAMMKLAASALTLTVVAEFEIAYREGHNFFATTAPASQLMSFVSQSDEDVIEFEYKEPTLYLSTEKREAEMATMDFDDFPSVIELDNNSLNEIGSVNAGALLEAISAVKFACSSNQEQPVLTAVYMRFENNQTGEGQITLAGADSFQLATKTILTGEPVKFKGAALPQASSLDFAPIFKDTGEKVTIYVNKQASKMYFACKGMRVDVSIIEGNYPRYESFIPKPDAFQCEYTVNREELIKANRFASTFSDSKASSIIPNFLDISQRADGPGLVVSSISQIGRNKTRLNITGFKGIPIKIAVNPKFLEEALQAIDAQEITLCIQPKEGDRQRGFQIKYKDAAHIVVIMPLHFQETQTNGR